MWGISRKRSLPDVNEHNIKGSLLNIVLCSIAFVAGDYQRCLFVYRPSPGPELAVCSVNFSRCTWRLHSNALSSLICSTASIGVVQRWIIPQSRKCIVPYSVRNEMPLMQKCQLHICKNIHLCWFCWALELRRLKIKVSSGDSYKYMCVTFTQLLLVINIISEILHFLLSSFYFGADGLKVSGWSWSQWSLGENTLWMPTLTVCSRLVLIIVEIFLLKYLKSTKIWVWRNSLYTSEMGLYGNATKGFSWTECSQVCTVLHYSDMDEVWKPSALFPQLLV